MNKVAVWLIYAYVWWMIDSRSDDLLYRYARRYWAGVDSLIKFGMLATVAFLGLVALLAFDDTCNFLVCESRLNAFLDAPANEVGDTLAGLAGGLAFLWIVVTVLLQGKELAAQRQELTLTRKEMVEQRKASQEMASALSKQSASLDNEQRRSRELEAERQLDSIVKSIENKCRSISKYQKGPTFKSDEDSEDNEFSEVLLFREPILTAGDDLVSEMFGTFNRFEIMIRYGKFHGTIKRPCNSERTFRDLLKLYDSAQSTLKRLGADQITRFGRLEIDGSRKSLLKILDHNIWEEEGGSIEIEEALKLFYETPTQ